MADKLAKAKEVALEIDPDFYAKLWVNSHESTPEWSPPADPAYGDSYLGNGYYPTWCADVARRQLARAAADPRYAFGESIVTHWPWPNQGFGGGNDCVRALKTDGGRTVTVAMPILHFLGLLNRMGPEYHVLPEQTVGGHVIGGFASRDGKAVRVLLYSHNPLDTESRSGAEFDVSLRLSGLSGGKLAATEYRFDKDHNSYFRLARRERDRPQNTPADPARADRLQEAVRELESDKPETQFAGLEKLADLGPAAGSALGAVYQLHERSRDDKVRAKAMDALKRLMSSKTYPAESSSGWRSCPPCGRPARRLTRSPPTGPRSRPGWPGTASASWSSNRRRGGEYDRPGDDVPHDGRGVTRPRGPVAGRTGVLLPHRRRGRRPPAHLRRPGPPGAVGRGRPSRRGRTGGPGAAGLRPRPGVRRRVLRLPVRRRRSRPDLPAAADPGVAGAGQARRRLPAARGAARQPGRPVRPHERRAYPPWRASAASSPTTWTPAGRRAPRRSIPTASPSSSTRRGPRRPREA